MPKGVDNKSRLLLPRRASVCLDGFDFIRLWRKGYEFLKNIRMNAYAYPLSWTLPDLFLTW